MTRGSVSFRSRGVFSGSSAENGTSHSAPSGGTRLMNSSKMWVPTEPNWRAIGFAACPARSRVQISSTAAGDNL